MDRSLWRRTWDSICSWIISIFGFSKRRPIPSPIRPIPRGPPPLFSDLPPEIVVPIFKELVKDKNHKIWNYRLVSKQFDFLIDKCILPGLSNPGNPAYIDVDFKLETNGVQRCFGSVCHRNRILARIPSRRKVTLLITTDKPMQVTDHHLDLITSQIGFLRDAEVGRLFFYYKDLCDWRFSARALTKFFKNPTLRRHMAAVRLPLNGMSMPQIKACMRYVHSLPEQTRVTLCGFNDWTSRVRNRLNPSQRYKPDEFRVEVRCWHCHWGTEKRMYCPMCAGPSTETRKKIELREERSAYQRFRGIMVLEG